MQMKTSFLLLVSHYDILEKINKYTVQIFSQVFTSNFSLVSRFVFFFTVGDLSFETKRANFTCDIIHEPTTGKSVRMARAVLNHSDKFLGCTNSQEIPPQSQSQFITS